MIPSLNILHSSEERKAFTQRKNTEMSVLSCMMQTSRLHKYMKKTRAVESQRMPCEWEKRKWTLSYITLNGIIHLTSQRIEENLFLEEKINMSSWIKKTMNCGL